MVEDGPGSPEDSKSTYPGKTDIVDGPGSPEDGVPTDMAEQRVSPYGLQGTVTMADYMRERYTSFELFDTGIRDGSLVLQSLRLYESGVQDGYMHDQEAIRDLWEELCGVRIDLDHPARETTEDGYLSFSFDSGKELIVFPFCTSEYARFAEDATFPVKDPDVVRALVDRTSALVEQDEGQAGDEVPYESGAYLWDADGDGMREHLWADFIDNGDEAPSLYTIRIFSETMDVEGYLDRAYSIEKMEASSDERGPYLTVYYEQGDYYGHDNVATSVLRVVDGELVVE